MPEAGCGWGPGHRMTAFGDTVVSSRFSGVTLDSTYFSTRRGQTEQRTVNWSTPWEWQIFKSLFIWPFWPFLSERLEVLGLNFHIFSLLLQIVMSCEFGIHFKKNLFLVLDISRKKNHIQGAIILTFKWKKSKMQPAMLFWKKKKKHEITTYFKLLKCLKTLKVHLLQ